MLRWVDTLAPKGSYNDHCDGDESSYGPNCWGFVFDPKDLAGLDLARADEWRIGAYHAFSFSSARGVRGGRC